MRWPAARRGRVGPRSRVTVGRMSPLALDLDDTDVSVFTRVRVLTFAAVGSIVTGYTAVAALLAVVTAIAPLAHFSTVGVLRAALPAWLAAHQVPLEFGGLELGVLPLLATVGIVLIAMRAAAGAAERLGLTGPWQAGQAIGAIALAHGAVGLTVALAVSEVSADPLAAFYYPALIAALGATWGVLRRCGLWAIVVARADAVALCGLRAGLVAVLLLLAAGAALLAFALLTSVSTAVDLFAASAPSLGAGFGMLLLSIGFVPNAVVAAVAFLAGPGFSMGVVSVSPLGVGGGPVPGLPLLAALPEQAAAWWPVLVALPVGIGVLIGRRLREVSTDPTARVRAAAVAAGVVGIVFVVLAGSAGGRVGAGPFDPVSLRAAAVSMALVVWIGVPAAITAWLGGPRTEPLGLPDTDQTDDDPEQVDPLGTDQAGDDPEPAGTDQADSEPDRTPDEDTPEPTD